MKEEHRFDASQCWSSVASNSTKGIFCIARVKQVVPVGGIPAEAFILVTRVRRRSVCEEMADTICDRYEAIPGISLGATKITGGILTSARRKGKRLECGTHQSVFYILTKTRDETFEPKKRVPEVTRI